MSVRQEKIASVIKKELGKFFQQNAIIIAKGAMITTTVVRMSPDLSIAKVYISIFGGKNNDASFQNIVDHSKLIRHEISKAKRVSVFVRPSRVDNIGGILVRYRDAQCIKMSVRGAFTSM